MVRKNDWYPVIDNEGTLDIESMRKGFEALGIKMTEYEIGDERVIIFFNGDEPPSISDVEDELGI